MTELFNILQLGMNVTVLVSPGESLKVRVNNNEMVLVINSYY